MIPHRFHLAPIEGFSILLGMRIQFRTHRRHQTRKALQRLFVLLILQQLIQTMQNDCQLDDVTHVQFTQKLHMPNVRLANEIGMIFDFVRSRQILRRLLDLIFRIDFEFVLTRRQQFLFERFELLGNDRAQLCVHATKVWLRLSLVDDHGNDRRPDFRIVGNVRLQHELFRQSFEGRPRHFVENQQGLADDLFGGEGFDFVLFGVLNDGDAVFHRFGLPTGFFVDDEGFEVVPRGFTVGANFGRAGGAAAIFVIAIVIAVCRLVLAHVSQFHHLGTQRLDFGQTRFRRPMTSRVRGKLRARFNVL
mmetsp:Transcript_7913/g.12512  ORF Transcript_7913/g.12512 Transcript_7913/m.12512 type:complete len:305 (-) Transcript_7913:179-1093(-)